ncbi:MAG: hypothetical protein JXA52_06000 [Planctomycetes bacterium]|nr:hypothetical protein [Planctomycetota bacterium]
MGIANQIISVRAGASSRTFLIKPLVLTLLVIVGPCLAGVAGAASELPSNEISSQELQKGIELATRYLTDNCNTSGRFTYLRHLEEERDYGKEYNMLRHAGAIYALAQAEERSPQPEVRKALARSSAYLKVFISGPFKEAPEAIALWSMPEIIGKDHNSKSRLQAKLGGSGLSLVALTAAHQIDPEIISLQELRSLAEFILFMQKPDGSFYSKYFPAEGRDDSWTSLYYPGEAMLGLLLLSELDPDPRWPQAAAKGMAYLASLRHGREKVEPDHWALLATEKLLLYYDRLKNPPVSRETLLAHARQVCTGIISEQFIDVADPIRYGSFGLDARTCPAATRLEGLLAADAFLPPAEQALRQEIKAAIERGMRFLLRMQVKTGPLAGAVPYAAQTLTLEPELQKLNLQPGEVRIDYVQHALCAMMQYEKLLLPSPE